MNRCRLHFASIRLSGLLAIVCALLATTHRLPAPVTVLPTPTPKPKATPKSKPKPTPKTTSQKTNTPSRAAENLPYGQPVRGLRGYVISPYAPKAGMIDVRGFSRGTKAVCPYTGRVFLAP